MEKVLLQEKKYKGKYVALRSASDKTVIAEGDDPSTVRKRASKKGVEEPLIFFVSEPDTEVGRVY
ncbi:hypothetical protein ES703_53124 [subsurface metagenome]